MIALVQCVNYASVTVANKVVANINYGILVFVGVTKNDSSANALAIFNKLRKFRMFSDANKKMNLNIEQVAGEVLLVPQFTLTAETKRGNRPSFFNYAADPKIGRQLFTELCLHFKNRTNLKIETGIFQANMQVKLENNGPLTFWLEK